MEFYTNKQVVVTGGAGFVGGHLCELLSNHGAFVTVLDTMSRTSMSKYPPPLSPYIHSYPVDCGDAEAMRPFLRDVDIVFNLAADVAGVIHNADNNADMFASNVRLQTAPVFAAAEAGVKHFLQVSSVCVYSPSLNHPALESHGHTGEPHRANMGYAWAKRMGERVAGWQLDSFEKMVIVRPSNVYGPRDWFDDKAHVVPALIKKIYEGESDYKITLHGSGSEIRELVYVKDTARAMAYALAYGASGEAYNIGSGYTTTIMHLAEDLVKVMVGVIDNEIEIHTTPAAESGDPLRWCDFSKLKEIGWTPKYTSPTHNLRKTVDYFRREK